MPKARASRLFRLLGSRARSRSGARAEDEGHAALEEGALWSTHQRASSAVRESGEAAQRMASVIAKQRGAVDALADRARAVSARSGDLSASFGRLKDAFERLELVALNAGLEAARLGEGPGQSLALVSEEIRSQARRGTEACRDLGLSLGEVGSELTQVHSSLDRARETSGELAQEAARASGASASAERALSELSDRMKEATGSDPETSKALAEASEHARALVAALGALRDKAPSAVVAAVLRPVLEPLVRLLDGDDAEPSSREPSGSRGPSGRREG